MNNDYSRHELRKSAPLGINFGIWRVHLSWCCVWVVPIWALFALGGAVECNSSLSLRGWHQKNLIKMSLCADTLQKIQASQNTVKNLVKTNPWELWPICNEKTAWRSKPNRSEPERKKCARMWRRSKNRPPVARPVARPVTFAQIWARQMHTCVRTTLKVLRGATKPRLTTTTNTLKRKFTRAFQNLATTSDVAYSLLSMIWQYPKQWMFVHQFRQHWLWGRKSRFKDSQTAMLNQV